MKNPPDGQLSQPGEPRCASLKRFLVCTNYLQIRTVEGSTNLVRAAAGIWILHNFNNMDPLSISAGVAGFVSLTIQLVSILKEYTSTVKAAPSEAQTLLTELASLSQVLQQLTNFLKKPEHNVNFRETSVLCSVVAICDDKIKGLYTRLDKFRSAGGLRERWKWPFQKQECLEIAQTLHHCAQTIELSLTISNG